MPIQPAEVPRAVRLAALLFAAYGVMVVANAWLLQSAAGWEGTNDFPRALVRLAGCGLIAWGLMRGRRWAWWFAVALGGLWTLMGAAALAMLSAAGAWGQAGAPTPAFLAMFMVMMAAAVALLLQPASRAAFR